MHIILLNKGNSTQQLTLLKSNGSMATLFLVLSALLWLNKVVSEEEFFYDSQIYTNTGWTFDVNWGSQSGANLICQHYMDPPCTSIRGQTVITRVIPTTGYYHIRLEIGKYTYHLHLHTLICYTSHIANISKTFIQRV